MARFVLEGTISRTDAEAIVQSVSSHFASRADVCVVVGKRTHLAGGIEPALLVALTALTIQVIDFFIRLSDRPREKKSKINEEFRDAAPKGGPKHELLQPKVLPRRTSKPGEKLRLVVSGPGGQVRVVQLVCTDDGWGLFLAT